MLLDDIRKWGQESRHPGRIVYLPREEYEALGRTYPATYPKGPSQGTWWGVKVLIAPESKPLDAVKDGVTL